MVEVEGVTKDDAAETAAEEKGVPDFWFNAMKNHEILAEEVRPCIFFCNKSYFSELSFFSDLTRV